MGESTPLGLISIYRPAAVWRDRARRYWIEINGVRAGQIGHDEHLEFPVHPGVYDLRAAIDWTGSPVVRLAVAPSQTVRLTVEPAGNSFQFWQSFTKQGYLKLIAN